MPKILADGVNVRRRAGAVESAVRSIAAIRQPDTSDVSTMTVLEVRQALADGTIDRETAYLQELDGRRRATVLAMTEV